MVASPVDIFRIPADCGPAAIADTLTPLRQRVAAASPDLQLALDLTEGRPTAIALQLLASASRSLARKAAFAGYGPAAGAILSYEQSIGDADDQDRSIR